jgi:hypothetical protein
VHETTLNLDGVEILAYLQDDDKTADQYHDVTGLVKFVRGPRILLSDMWNVLIPHAKGDIFQQMGDDVLFRTPAWDRYVEAAFAVFQDRILLVHGNDGHWNAERFATLPFVSREWVDAVGHFTGPGFAVDFSDTWPNDVADMIFRKKYLPLFIEHNHWIWGKSEMDETYQEIQTIRLSSPNHQAAYNSRLPERMADVEKLRKVMR